MLLHDSLRGVSTFVNEPFLLPLHVIECSLLLNVPDWAAPPGWRPAACSAQTPRRTATTPPPRPAPPSPATAASPFSGISPSLPGKHSNFPPELPGFSFHFSSRIICCTIRSLLLIPCSCVNISWCHDVRRQILFWCCFALCKRAHILCIILEMCRNVANVASKQRLFLTLLVIYINEHTTECVSHLSLHCDEKSTSVCHRFGALISLVSQGHPIIDQTCFSFYNKQRSAVTKGKTVAHSLFHIHNFTSCFVYILPFTWASAASRPPARARPLYSGIACLAFTRGPGS